MRDRSDQDLRELFQKGLFHHHYANTAYPLTPRSWERFRVDDPQERLRLATSDWESCDTMALYVHVPFCKVRCRFCEYAVLSGEDAEAEDLYVSLLLEEIRMYGRLLGKKKVTGYDIGGGTPTKLRLENLRAITSAVVDTFDLAPEVAWSVETTPVIAANEPEKIQGLFETGYRRISMGIQTVSEKLLNELGREGATSMYERAVANIRKAGFQRLNIDLMYGFLHQDLDDFEHTLRYAVELDPEYITLYRNRYKGTKLEGEAGGVSIFKVIGQYRLARRLLNDHGYAGGPGKNTFSRLPGDHGTSDYLTGRVVRGTPYLGMGLGAQSFGRQYLSYNEGAASKTLAGYRSAVEPGILPIQDCYALDQDEAVAKMVSVAFYFGFVDFDAFQERFGIGFRDLFPRETKFVLEEGLMELRDGGIHLTDRGADYVNGVIPLFQSQRSRLELDDLVRRGRRSDGEKTFLGTYSLSDFERPSVAADVVLLSPGTDGSGRERVLLIRRGEHPFLNDWALPGGFVDPGETVEEAALRELREETGLSASALRSLGVFSQPGRDPRGWILSCAFAGRLDGEVDRPRFGEDAIDARWFETEFVDEGEGRFVLRLREGSLLLEANLECLPSGTFRPSGSTGIAFDHAQILATALHLPAPSPRE